MKKILLILLAFTMCVSMCSCVNVGESDTKYKLGDTVSTDIVEFTLDEASLTIALNNINGEKYCTPKEYNPSADSDNPYVAPTGHTFAYFSYTLKNIDRATVEINGTFARANCNEGKSADITIPAKYYYEAHEYYLNGQKHIDKALEWHKNDVKNILLSVGQKESHRAYIDIPASVSDLSEGFKITFYLPDSNGDTIPFTFVIE